MSSQYATDGKLGINVLRVDPTTGDNLNLIGPCYTPGTQVFTENNGKWVYCKLPAIAQIGSVILINPTTWTGVLITTTNAAAGIGFPVGAAPALANVGDYGWLQQSGVIDNIYTNVAAVNAQLNTTATGGLVDDDGTTGAGVLGNFVLTTAKTISAGVAPGYATGLAVSGTHA